MNTVICLEDFKSRLEKLKKSGPSNNSRGICYQVVWITGIHLHAGFPTVYSVVKFVSDLSEGWPHHSGVGPYPVPKAQPRQYDLWKGEQGRLRWDLVDYLIVQAEKKIAELTQKSE